MSHGLVPSKSTVYVSNLPFALTNNDLFKIFEKCGKIVKITILKDKETRESKGVAFILFLKDCDAYNCVTSFDGKQIGERTIRVKIATDNGRSREFIRKRIYTDKSRCYECGENGHLSYECPKNTLGYRKPPPKKKKKKAATVADTRTNEPIYWQDSDDENTSVAQSSLVTKSAQDESDSQEEEEPDLETLSAAIRIEQEKLASAFKDDTQNQKTKKRFHKSAYFSDEEEISD